MNVKLLLIVLIYFKVFSLQLLLAQDSYSEKREEMVNKQIKFRGVTDKQTINSMLKVERHKFVPPEFEKNAYDDRPLPIGYGQTISQPYIVAYMTNLLNLNPGDTILEIGTGSGYQAAVLAEIVNQVYTVEIVEELGVLASKRLKELNYNNVNVKISDGYYGWNKHGPYDGIIVTAASEYIPPPLIAQLKDGARMIIPVGSPLRVQTLMMVTKKGDKVSTHSLLPVRFVPFTRNE